MKDACETLAVLDAEIAMSVWTSAVIAHPWMNFSEEVIQRISIAATQSDEAPRWFGNSAIKTAEEDFKASGYASFFLPEDFSLYFYSNILELERAIRWSGILRFPEGRNAFVQSCKSVAPLTAAEELILLPEGVADLFLDRGMGFEKFKQVIEEKLGPPDLDIRKLYTEQEVEELSQARYHYFYARIADL